MTEKKQHYSVLMSVYHKEKPDFLRESMQSMFDQTVPTDDFVLVCDGPLSSGLDAVIEEMQKKYSKRLRVIRLEKNGGLGHALNVGVKECKNELIARMDSDDVAMSSRIELQLGMMEKGGVDVLGGNITEYDEKMSTATGRRIVPSDHDGIIKMMKKRNAMNHVTVMYKKSKVIDTGSYLDMPGFEDYYLWVRMIKNGCLFHNLQENMVNVRCGSEMIKRRGGKEYVGDVKRFEKAIQKLGFISYPNYLLNVSERMFASLIPNNARGFLYKKVLRK